MSAGEHHDVVGVGIGPFNLGLAALLDPVPDLRALLFDARTSLTWHEGMMLPGAEVQVPFLADLVSLVDPTSPHSFLSYLADRGRLLRFYLYERMHVPRAEMSDYYEWAAARLESCRLGHRVEAVDPLPDGGWSLEVAAPHGRVRHRADAVVLGVGTRPSVPECARRHLGASAFHSADYMPNRARALAARSVTVVGSGQSAAEIFADLLEHGSPEARLSWYTSSPGFLPMEYSKLGLEHFSPEYASHFHSLAEERREAIRAGQDLLYKGISAATSARIYDRLYALSIDREPAEITYRARCRLDSVEAGSRPDALRLGLTHLDEQVAFAHETEILVLATGYRQRRLPVPRLAEIAELDSRGRPIIERDHRIRLRSGRPSTLFVQNAEIHTHGVGAPDLGLGAHRNATIVNAILGRDEYPLPERNVFQRFGAPRAEAGR